MASSSAPAPAVDGEDSIATLKRLREVEAEGDARLAAVKSDGADRLARLHSETGADLAKAREEADHLHDAMVAAARREIETEAERILEGGREEAGHVSYRSGKTLESAREAILDALVEDFRPKRPITE